MNVGSHRRWAPEGRRGRIRRLPAIGRFLAGVASGVLAGVAAHANPVGPTVVHGTAQFARPDTSTLNVTNSANAIINWQGFSIDSAEVTRFIQPSATSAVLNRVTGSDPSTILGQLLSNGRVFLVNPHGIVFGEGAVVDTAGLVASTLGIGDADFLAGRYRFNAGPDAGDITNRGLIEAGADGVFLLAPNIENSGIIRTDGGDLVLAAGRTVTLTSLDLDGVQVEVQAPEDEVLNLGDLIAERGAVGAFAGSIRNSGTVEANAVTVDDDGTIRLVAQGDITLEEGSRVAAEGPSGGEVHIESETGTTWVSGEVSARGSEGRGGTIRLLGHQVGLDGAEVDASGPEGGGEVLVGGDESGEGSVPTADSTYVSSDSTVSADALDDGDGGKVVVFAEGFANILGRLSARGGPNGGDGGFVETSGRESFVILHTPDTTAPNGEGGHWLIDPNNIEIVPGTGADNISDTNPFTSTDDAAQIGIDLIIAALSGGQTVTVQTTEGGGNTEGGYIILNAALDVERTSGTNTLILDAHEGIRILRPITDAAGGAALHLVLDADGDGIVAIDADVTLYGGSLRTRARDNRAHVSDGATVTLDGATWFMNNIHLLIGDDGFANGPGRVVLQNGATLEGPGSETNTGIFVGASDGHGILTVRGGSVVRGFRWILVGHGAGGTGTLNVESGGSVMAKWIDIGNEGGFGTATVTGPGSMLRSVGDENAIVVGEKGGTGTLNVENGGNVTARWINIGDDPGSGTVTGTGTVIVTGPGSTITTVGIDNAINVGDEGTGELTVEDGGEVRTNWFDVGNQAGSRGTVTVTGPGSAIVTVGTGNLFRVGVEGVGILHVLDGALVETLDFRVANSGVGRALISGVAADGSRSRVIVSPANGKNAGDIFADEAGYVRVARDAGSNGRLEIREGGLLRVLDGDGTHGPLFDIARHKGSVGTLLIDGAGSSLEIIQNGPAVPGSRDIFPGPAAQLGRRGNATTIIRNGGRLLAQGESAFVRISLDGIYERFPDPDTGPINQRSVVRVESGGRMEIRGERATLVIGDSGPAADGTLIVTGQGSMLILTGAGNRLVVGDDGARGRLELRDGGTARYATLVVGASGRTNLLTSEGVVQAVDALVDDILPPEEIVPQPVDEDDDEDTEEAAAGLGESGESAAEEPEELPMCPA